jgi:hypothetical protein
VYFHAPVGPPHLGVVGVGGCSGNDRRVWLTLLASEHQGIVNDRLEGSSYG